MLRPEKMTRTVIVGSIEGVDATVECLYDLGVLHLIDFTRPDEEFQLGQPLAGASDASQRLLKLRSMIRSLELEEHEPAAKVPEAEIDNIIEQALVTLDLNTTKKVEAKLKIQSMIRERESEISAVTPFIPFGIPIEYYSGYDNITAITGMCSDDPEEDLSSKIGDFELFTEKLKSEVTVALFVKTGDRAEAARILSQHGYQELKVPKMEGSPKVIVERNTKDIAGLQKNLDRAEKDIEAIRKKFADFIIASEEDLSIEVLKAETPLRIAESANSFVIDGWVPESIMAKMRERLDTESCGRVYVESLESQKEEEPPVKLKHSRAVRPYELFINLVSTPKYTEIDPTIVLFVTFPIFFGFMMGDLGLGAGLVAMGLFLRFTSKSASMRRLGIIVVVAGSMSALFGLFVYCEAFGVPFHPPAENPTEHAWSSLVNIPLHPIIDKLVDVKELLAISLAAGWMHLTIGLGFGMANNWEHKKHALGKLAWILLLFGIFEEIMSVAGNSTVTSKLFNQTLFSPLPSTIVLIIGVKVSVPALVFALVGIAALLVTEGAVVLTEVLSIFANLVSYARLAALAVGHGAMGLAFNTMLFPVILGDNIALSILGALALGASVVVFIFLLGSLSIGIQAIRLNYVEFFLKFFEGGGTDFSPLRYSRKYSVETT